MELKKQGIRVDCMNCKCASSDGCGGFIVTVPLSDSETGITGTAKLHCTISPACHQVEFVDWHDAGFHTIRPSRKIQSRISAALTFVAEHRICGNRHICPSELVRVVEELGRQ
jgi:hypothetical protein